VRRVHEGISRPLLYRGKQVYVEGRRVYESEYSDQLLMFLLKANNPEKFRDRMEIKNLMDLDPTTWTDEQLEVLYEFALKKSGGDPVKQAELRRAIDGGALVIDAESTAVEPRST
jgi:hypothetical protein